LRLIANTYQGNCKFGAKCALAHILPDGRRVNRPPLTTGPSHLTIGGRVNPEIYHNQGSALHNSLLHANLQNQSLYSSQNLFSAPEDFPPLNGSPSLGGLSPHPDSKYGSPREDGRWPLSPLAGSHRGLSILDAPLPPSLDSNDISYFARHGPIAASVPSKFGMDSPPSSLPPQSDALKSLYASAYDDSRGRTVSQGQSPPNGSEEYFGSRTMHSQRVSRQKVFSSSVPRQFAPEDWDTGFNFEDDTNPVGRQDFFRQSERSIRFARPDDEASVSNIVSIGGLGSPGEGSSKVGSPNTSTPSRFGPLFTRQKREDETSNPLSILGHVGSPLRMTTSHLGTSPGVRAISRPTSGDSSPYFSSPPRNSVSISAITQQLQRSHIQRTESDKGESGGHYSPGHYTASKLMNNSSSRGLSRALSSSSIGGRGNVTSIDEEKDEFVFSMDEDDSKRLSGDRWGSGRRSPAVGAIGGERRSGLANESKGDVSQLSFVGR
jgi:hypothetical protein